MHNRYAFIGGASGRWLVTSVRQVQGLALESVQRVDVTPATGAPAPESGTTWRIDGQISNLRYATRRELTTLRSKQETLGRAQARLAAMIPIKKSAAWWDLAQDERRAVFEESSHHTEIGLAYLPAVARQLYHCRDLGEPFDFVTWFEFAPEHMKAFEELVTRLRKTREWQFVEREVDIRLELRP